MFSAGNLHEIVSYYVVVNVQELCAGNFLQIDCVLEMSSVM